ncbi:MAG: 2-oxo acid dehydrogenase subunit E2 [Actinobacteria bacterium]|nr:2-oxo acid dehydrogenase subunit E2 [Actinomycetota bacterium]
MSVIAVPMPQMGVSVDEGTVIEWHVGPGETIAAEQPLCDVSTDKVDSEVASPIGGVVEELLVEPGTTVAVGVPIARIRTAESTAGLASADDGPAADQGADPRPAAAEPPSAAAPAADGAGAPAHDASGRRYSPLVQRMAAAHGIDLSKVAGTGRGGRVQKADVQAAIDAGGTAAAPGAGAAPPTASPTAAPPADGESQTMSRMRQAIARHMLHSRATAAHCHTWIEVDMTAIEAARAAAGTTALPFVAEATVRTLRAHPDLNAWIDGDRITRHANVDLGIAVSLGAEGLIVPVLREAQALSVTGLDRGIRAMARAAREGALKPDDVGGGTFTITNQGKFGTLMSAPIINQPQVGILDVEAVVKRPVVVTGPDGSDAIAIRSISIFGLSWDHRAIDGAGAAEFLATLRDNLQNPASG